MTAQDNTIPISALQHLLFCERQCALIHIERVWVENRLTVEGRRLHEKAHTGPSESRPGVRIARSLTLRSETLGLFGVADIVEFHALDDTGRPRDPPLPFPVEYKRGRPKANDADRVQLCAQAICLEEMLDVPVPEGALFYGQTRRRENVVFDEALRSTTRQAAVRTHEMLHAGVTPIVAEQPKCKRCSLAEVCMPKVTGASRSARRYLRQALTRQDESP